MSRGEGVTQSPLARLLFDEGTDKTFSKNFEKPLDKRHKMCYNNNVIKRGQTLKKQKGNKKLWL